MKKRKITTLALLFIVYLILLALPQIAYSTEPASVKNDIEQYFSNIEHQFNRVASSQIIKKSNLHQVDRHFVYALKKNQTFFTLLRVNSKGKIINEIVRGQKTKPDYRNVQDQLWFSYVQKKRKDYHGFLKGDNGRYYLFWSKPYFYRSRSRQKRFGGAVVVKIDLWDAFYRFAANTDQPFLIKIYGKTLYSNKWREKSNYKQVPLNIPGIKNISLRYNLPTINEVTTSKIKSTENKDTVKSYDLIQEKNIVPTTSYKIILFFETALIIILSAILIRILFWYKRWKSLNKSKFK